MPSTYQVSVEELALALSIQGKPEAASGLLQATFGTLTPDDQRGRLLAAGASLAARSLLAVQDTEKPMLDPGFCRLVAPLLAPRFSIKYDKATSATLDTVACHFAREDGLVVEQTVRQGVVHTLTEIDAPTLIEHALRIFSIPAGAPTQAKRVRMPRAVFDDARSRAALQPTTAESLFHEAGLPAKAALELVEDLANNKYQGSVMRIDYDKEGQPVSDRGFLTLQSRRRAWILAVSVKEDEATISPYPATAESFRREVEGLLR